ncbi:hypothetical protein GDO86_005176 [Hymenochirus boettgeri]|uniref:MD-2-related lipid-recognition domain-containing protein n=1 Tax=Hymenochirus boettgeri TaxID=247094 RepID=A0A8T2J8X0_9PIPI|nr:hypothetical protein GDO86_005176 [Hymenochirus boettgeri]
MARLCFFLQIACAALIYSTCLAQQSHDGLTTITGIGWSSCDEDNLPGKVESLTMSPNPLSIPGSVNISKTFVTSETLVSPIKIIFKVEMKVKSERSKIKWIHVPCFEYFGSCTINNACGLLDSLFKVGNPCPAPLSTNNIPCHCPFNAGTYTLPVTSFDISDAEWLQMVPKGTYRSSVIVYSGHQKISCTVYEFELK